MKAFRDLVVIKQPLEQVWMTVRERLPELAAQLDDIESISCLERERIDASRQRVVNRWLSTQKIPAVLQARLGTAAVSWLDRNEWNDSAHTCAWAIEPSVLPEYIRCAGQTTYQPAMGGRGTRVIFAGEFELTPTALKELAGPLEQPATVFVESIVTIFIPKNLRKTMDAVGRLIAAGP